MARVPAVENQARVPEGPSEAVPTAERRAECRRRAVCSSALPPPAPASPALASSEQASDVLAVGTPGLPPIPRATLLRVCRGQASGPWGRSGGGSAGRGAHAWLPSAPQRTTTVST